MMTDETESTDKAADEASDEEATEEAKADPTPLEQAQAEAARIKEVLMRTAADYDNFRKRSRRELEDARRGGREDLLKDLLPVFDNLERAVNSAQRATDVKNVADGIAMVIRQFTDSLARGGITRVPTIGSAFDPQVHEAIQQVETDEHPPGTVVAEVQPGYLNGDRLVRAAMVVVSRPKPAQETPGSETPNEEPEGENSQDDPGDTPAKN
jgi:molecular chaperone GrpE